MFENIGGKIKGLAKALFWIEAIAAVIVGLILVEDTDGLSLLYAIGGVLVAWISSWFLYGFGEIIDMLAKIERNTSKTADEAVAKTAAKPATTNPAISAWLKQAAKNTTKDTVLRCPYCGDIVKQGRCEMCGRIIPQK